MRRATLGLGLTVIAGAVVTVGSGWRAERANGSRAAVNAWRAPRLPVGAKQDAGYPASQWAESDSAGLRWVSGKVSVEAGPEHSARLETAAPTSLPWLRNFAAAAESAVATPLVVERMTQWRALDTSCSAAGYGGLSIRAEVAGRRGSEEVLASFTQGVLVLDAAGKLLASATAPECQGSADELVAIAAGDAHIDGPVIALALTTGGHRASTTWLVLYRVIGGVVAPVFSGAVEERLGEQVRRGEVTLLPGALVYQAPSGKRTLFSYSVEQVRYGELTLDVPAGA
jgi:hypothetical protein